MVTLFRATGDQGSFHQCASKSSFQTWHTTQFFSRKITERCLFKRIIPIITYYHSMLRRTDSKRRVDVPRIATHFVLVFFIDVSQFFQCLIQNKCAHRNLCPLPSRSYRTHVTWAHVGSDKETPISNLRASISKIKNSISFTNSDIEGALFDTNANSISGDVNMKVLSESDLQYRRFFDIVLLWYRNRRLQYRSFSGFRHLI